MKRNKFEGLVGAKSPSKIQRGDTVKGVKCYKREGVRRKMDNPTKTAKSSRGYEMIHILIERGLRINSTK